MRAEERLVEAFWRLLKRHASVQVTVSQLCLEAGVNRASFYRNFASIEDFLDEVEEEILPTDMPLVIMKIAAEQISYEEYDAFLRAEDQRFRKIAAFLGPKGDPRFAAKVRTAMAAEWGHVLPVELATAARQAIVFMSGGVFALLGEWAESGFDGSFATFTAEFRRLAVPRLVQVLKDGIPEP